MGDIAFARRQQSETLHETGRVMKGMRNYLIDLIHIEVLVIA
jgi:hypothetical protein